MTSAYIKLLTVLLFLSVFSAGCAKKSEQGTHRYLIPYLTADGSYKYKEVELTTLDSPTRLKGSTASIHYRPTSSGWGPAAEPKLTKSGNVWIAENPESGMAISAYATMEAIRKWEATIDPSTQSIYPRTIVIDVEVRSRGEDLVNNAAYDGETDAILVVPYSRNGIPLAVNQGIMAHEHFHAQYFHRFYRAIYEKYIKGDKRSYNNRQVLDAWNEGLADFYAYAFTNQPRFMDASDLRFPSGATSLIRALDIAFESLSPIFMYTVDNKGTLQLNAKKDTCVTGSYYCLGTQVGRLLHQMSQNDSDKTMQLVRRVYQSLPSWEQKVDVNFTSKELSTNDFLRWTFEGNKSSLDPVQLQLLRKAGVNL